MRDGRGYGMFLLSLRDRIMKEGSSRQVRDCNGEDRWRKLTWRLRVNKNDPLIFMLRSMDLIDRDGRGTFSLEHEDRYTYFNSSPRPDGGCLIEVVTL